MEDRDKWIEGRGKDDIPEYEFRPTGENVPLKAKLMFWAVVIGGIAIGTFLFFFFITVFIYFFVPIFLILSVLALIRNWRGYQ